MLDSLRDCYDCFTPTLLKLLKFITKCYLFVAFEFIFILEHISVSLETINNYISRWLAYKSLHSVLMNCTIFFRVQVSKGPAFSGLAFSVSRFFRVQIFLGVDFSGSGSSFRSCLFFVIVKRKQNLISMNIKKHPTEAFCKKKSS